MTHPPASAVPSQAMFSCFTTQDITLASDFDLPTSLQKLAAARARDGDDIRAQAMPLGQVSAFSVSLCWATPFAGARSRALFEGRFEQNDTGVILTGHFKPVLPLWLCIGLLLPPTVGLWQRMPSLFDIIALCIGYGLIATTFYFMLARPAQRDARLLVQAMRQALRNKPEGGS